MMKKILFHIFLTAAFASSCTSLLEEEIYSQVGTDYLMTPKGFEDGVRACYVPLRSFYATEGGLSLTVFGTDTYMMGRDGSWKFVNQYTSQLNPRTGIITNIWRDFYRGINYCNTIIGRAVDVPLDENLKNQRVAEARFLRAHYYFLLVQMFGPIHIALEEVQGVTVEASRSPVSEVYKVITDDLEFAIQNLEVSPPDYGRATKPAAEHMLARVLLTRASSEAAEPGDYQRAADLATGVINNYDFKLLDDFSDVFAPAPGDRNEEVIWSVQYTPNQRLNGSGNTAHFYFAMVYSAHPGMQTALEYGRAWCRFRPTYFTLDTLFADRVNDTRYEKSFRHVFYCNRPGTYTVNGRSVTFEPGDTTIWLPGYHLPDEVIEQKDYIVLRPEDYSPQDYPTLLKYLDPNLPDLGESRGSRDMLACRLGETYLIAAEALMYAGNKTEAVKYINTLRVRAAREGYTPEETQQHEEAMKITEDQLNIDFILDERGRELLGEQFRWFDLVRTGKLVERVQKHNPDGASNIQEFHALRPIPQDQIDRTQGGQDVFPQNPGY